MKHFLAAIAAAVARYRLFREAANTCPHAGGHCRDCAECWWDGAAI